MPQVGNVYDTRGQCVGYITDGASNPNDVRGVIYWTNYEIPLEGKAFIALNHNGMWLIFTIKQMFSAALPSGFSAAVSGQALNFVEKPFSSFMSAMVYINNKLPLGASGVRPLVTVWGAGAAAATGALLLSGPAPKGRRRR